MSDIAFTTLRSAGYEGQLGDMLYAWSQDYPQDFNSSTLGGDGWTEYWRAGLGTAMPPLSPSSGDTFTALNGHSATFNGTDWDAVSPLTNNVAELLGNSTFLIDAVASVEGEQEAVNYGLGGSALDAQYGSTAAADTNDPLLLTHTGENYVYLPGGSTSSYLSVPSATNLNISDELELLCLVKPDSWSAAHSLLSRTAFSETNYGFTFSVLTGGKLRLGLYPTSSTASVFFMDSTVVPSFVDGTEYWVRATFVADDGANRVAEFFYAEATSDGSIPSSWTQIGGTVTGASVTFTGTPNSKIFIGLGAGNGPASWRRFVYRTAIDGSNVVDIDTATDITDAGATSFTASSGQTISVSRPTSGRKTALVTRPIWLFGTDDYMEVADNALLDFGASDSFTALMLIRRWNTTTSGPLISKAEAALSGTMVGYAVSNDATPTVSNRFGDGTNRVIPGDGGTLPPAGELALRGLARDVDADLGITLTGASRFTTTDTTTGSLANALDLRLMSPGDGTSLYSDGEVVAAAVWRRALTADEIAAINTYYGTV